MTLKIISAQEVLFDGEVTSVTLPGVMGSFTVLRNHAALIAGLVAGDIVYHDSEGTAHTTATGGGLVNVDDNIVSVCVY